VMVVIALTVAGQYFLIGVLLALWSLYSTLVAPLAKKIGYLVGGSELRSNRARALTVTGLMVAALVVAIFWVPAPSWTRTEGVAVAPTNAQVRTLTDGFITEVKAVPNQRVKRGDALVVLEDPELDARVRVFEAQLKEQQAKYTAAYEDRVQMNMIREEIEHIRARLENAQKRAREMVVRSPGDGMFIVPQPGDLPGRFVKRG